MRGGKKNPAGGGGFALTEVAKLRGVRVDIQCGQEEPRERWGCVPGTLLPIEMQGPGQGARNLQRRDLRRPPIARV